jgi:hypothetical protein
MELDRNIDCIIPRSSDDVVVVVVECKFRLSIANEFVVDVVVAVAVDEEESEAYPPLPLAFGGSCLVAKRAISIRISFWRVECIGKYSAGVWFSGTTPSTFAWFFYFLFFFFFFYVINETTSSAALVTSDSSIPALKWRRAASITRGLYPSIDELRSTLPTSPMLPGTLFFKSGVSFLLFDAETLPVELVEVDSINSFGLV